MRVIALLIAMSTSLSLALAQDNVKSVPKPDIEPSKVWVNVGGKSGSEAWEDSSVELRRLQIVDFDFQNLTAIEPGAVAPTKFSSQAVQAVEVDWSSASGREAFRLFESAEYARAIEAAKQAIAANELPRWQQKILGAAMVESFIGINQPGIAGRAFVSLSKESPPELLYASMPLNWFNDRPESGLADQAREWLRMESPSVAPLLGASWLLNTGEAKEAKATLERITASKVPVLASLASAQLWRIALPNEVSQNVVAWKQARDRMPTSLQLGPTLAIAYKLQSSGESEAAMEEWMRASLGYPRHLPNVARATKACTELMSRTRSKSDVDAFTKSLSEDNAP